MAKKPFINSFKRGVLLSSNNTGRVLIVFAQAAEAEATLRRLHAEPVEGETIHVWSEGEIPCLYRFERGHIAISNLGLHAAQMSVARYSQGCDEVWNLGLAGALNDRLPIGSLFSIGMVGKYIPAFLDSFDPLTQECVAFTLPHFNLEQHAECLISSDFPVHHLEYRTSLAQKWDLVDMEGYGVAYASQYLKKKCRIWKIVSDFASPGGRELIRKHKAQLSDQMAESILLSLTKTLL